MPALSAGIEALGSGLHGRVERRQDDEALALEVVAGVVGRELAAHERQKRRVRRGAARVVDEAEVLLGGPLHLVVAREAFVGHALQHEVAPRERSVRVAPRLVVGGAAHDRDEQRELVQLELGQRFAEIELAREAETVDRARAVLSQVDLVDVRVHELALRVAELERYRHECLADLARPGHLVRQEVAAHELLRQRARALADLAGRNVHEDRARDCDRVDAEVTVEAPVLDGFERLDEQRRDLVGPDDDAVLAVRWEQAADQQRVQPHDRRRPARCVAQRGDAAADERDRNELLGLGVAGERKAARRELDAAQTEAVRAGPREARIFAVAQAAQLRDEQLGRQRAPHVELERRRIDLRRNVPAAAFELARGRPGEVSAVGDDEHERYGRQAQHEAAEA
jgi:hypothetical protein